MDMTAVAIIMACITFVLPLVVILADDRNWQRKK
jgi:hypothetical protein